MRIINLTLLLLLFSSIDAIAQRARTSVEIGVPPQVFHSDGQRSAICIQCCIWQDKRYSEGAVIKTEAGLLQCHRAEDRVGTNPLVWQRVRE